MNKYDVFRLVGPFNNDEQRDDAIEELQDIILGLLEKQEK